MTCYFSSSWKSFYDLIYWKKNVLKGIFKFIQKKILMIWYSLFKLKAFWEKCLMQQKILEEAVHVTWLYHSPGQPPVPTVSQCQPLISAMSEQINQELPPAAVEEESETPEEEPPLDPPCNINICNIYNLQVLLTN